MSEVNNQSNLNIFRQYNLSLDGYVDFKLNPVQTKEELEVVTGFDGQVKTVLTYNEMSEPMLCCYMKNSSNSTYSWVPMFLTKSECEKKIKMQIKVVDKLPVHGESNILYLVKVQKKDYYLEYIWLENEEKYEQIGTTDVDLSDYYKKSETYNRTEVDDKLSDKADKATTLGGYGIIDANIVTETSGSKITLGNNSVNIYSKEDITQMLDEKFDKSEEEKLELTISKSINNLYEIKQDNLISGENIKTINGNSLLGNGDLVITSSHPFLPSFKTGDTFYEFCRSIISAGVPNGSVYSGGVSCTGGTPSVTHDCWPDGLVQAECTVQAIKNITGQYILYIECYSTNKEPFVWSRIYWQDNEGKQGAMEYWLPFDSYKRVEKTDEANKIYGTDSTGQTTYNVSDFQEKLIDSGASQNIKTINSTSLLGSGSTTTFTSIGPIGPEESYEPKGKISEWLNDFSINKKPEAGSAYLAVVRNCSDMPFPFNENGNGEAFIYVPVANYDKSKNPTSIVYVIEITSTNRFKDSGNIPGKWLGIYQYETAVSPAWKMEFKGVMTSPVVFRDGGYKYMPDDDSDGASKYYVDKKIIDSGITSATTWSSEKINSELTVISDDITSLRESKQNKLSEGNNIIISGDTISVTGLIAQTGGTLSGDLNSSANMSATAFYETSDIRKKNIHGEIDLNKCYDMIDKCSEIIYSLKNEDKEQVGLIAQEVEEFFPELINIDKDGYKTLDYSRVVVIIMRVLKEILKDRK